MVAGTAEAQKEVAKLQGAKKAEKIFAAKEKEAKGNLNKLSGKGTNPNEKISPKVVGWEKKNGKIPSLAHRAEPKQVAQTAPTKDEIAKYKQDCGEDETYMQMKAEYADSRRKKPNSYFHPDKVSSQVKFKAKEGFDYKMSDGSILTYIGGKKGEHKFKDFKTGKTKFKDYDTIYALSEQKKRYGRIK